MSVTLALTIALAALAAGIGWRAQPGRASTIVAIALALVALLNVAYYAHGFDAWSGYFTYRTWWWSDLVPALSGLLVGRCLRLARLSLRLVAVTASVALALAAILGPWAKPLFLPLSDGELADHWQDGICMQTTSSTCGPCALANLLHAHGLAASERELAAEALTSGTGTELWYLARCARRRGFSTVFVSGAPALRPDAIVGLTLGGTGHFVAITGIVDGTVSIADSFAGARTLPLAKALHLLGTPGMSLLLVPSAP